jgi:hypothetical protein
MRILLSDRSACARGTSFEINRQEVKAAERIMQKYS